MNTKLLHSIVMNCQIGGIDCTITAEFPRPLTDWANLPHLIVQVHEPPPQLISGEQLAEALEPYSLCPAAEKILRELVADVEAVGVENVRSTWPDLATTYEHAMEYLHGSAPPTEAPVEPVMVRPDPPTPRAPGTCDCGKPAGKSGFCEDCIPF